MYARLLPPKLIIVDARLFGTLDYLIAQLRTGFRQKVYSIKTRPQVCFKPSRKNPDF